MQVKVKGGTSIASHLKHSSDSACRQTDGLRRQHRCWDVDKDGNGSHVQWDLDNLEMGYKHRITGEHKIQQCQSKTTLAVATLMAPPYLNVEVGQGHPGGVGHWDVADSIVNERLGAGGVPAHLGLTA